MSERHWDIEYKTPEQIAKMRVAGLLVAATLEKVREAVAPGVSTADLDALAEETIRAGGGIPSFLGYHGYPASLCTSVNDEVVHAIPNPKAVLREGDVISIDCGAIVDGWHGDSAITVGVGEAPRDVLRMAQVADDAMWAGIAAAARGLRSGRGRLTDISHAIQSSVRKAGRYGIVEGYGGHGIGTEMHQDPFVLNYGRPGKGPLLRPGLCVAIEPMLTRGKPRTVELEDGWTVVTADGSPAVHVEHSIALCDDGVWVLTASDGGRERLGDLVASAARTESPAQA
ncbi:type I methionyl aminopeptidase [Planosporangium mesophilum]|uniref:Methionine aminopeptidase n=1 Tax=Planosporangium mesophilum TaxID=689768 RepID=A0A8J3TEX9_9ACTN|nr:type I methionyl aminopeptidase [Planosporangium mesophilum]NJC84745.1 type I methionyl aminopeptidase [Planosporangium mesophilum]GII24236.1 methionine aminopeptidase [Planosporangium mesophilum]